MNDSRKRRRSALGLPHPNSPASRMHDWSSTGVPHPNSPAAQLYDWSTAGIPHPNSPAGQHTTSALKLTLKQRFIEVLKLTPNHMAPELAAQFRAMLTPSSMAMIAATFTLLAVSQAFGIGEVVDFILLLVGTFFVGMAVFTAAEDIVECAKTTVRAKTEADLDRAANYLAQAVAILGVVVFFALIAKIGEKFGGARSAEEGSSGAASAESAEKSATETSSSKTPAADEPGEPAPEPKASVASEIEGTEFKGVKLRVRPGADEKVAVIGRQMDNVVKPYAEGPGAKYNVETFSGDQISPEAQAEWNNLKGQYAPDPIPEDVVRDSQMFQENQAWAQKLKDQGYTVVDADNPEGKTASPFYDMEKQTLFGDAPSGGK